ncbi:MAG: diacylglycerol kinase [Candidatus Velthaea sp.]
MRATVIINLRSSRSERLSEEARALLVARGITVDDFQLVEGHTKITKRVRAAARRGAKLIIVGGGDGTMALAVNGLAYRKAALGVLPLGTGNSFAKTLGISEDLSQAVDVIAAGNVARVDLGVVNKTYFANFATIGLSAEIGSNTSHDLKKIIGPLAYAVGGVGPLLHHKPFTASVKWEGGRLDIPTQQMVIASGRYFGKQPLTPEATITDGKLAFFTTSGVSQLDVAVMYVAMGLGQQAHLPNAHALSAKRLTIRTKPKQPLSIDGDALGTTPAKFSIARAALRVCVPADFSG